jgi:pyridoxamine 5'-phosphate oxidase
MKAQIKKTSTEYNQEYFKKRSPRKNALAISSNQSREISTYQDVINKYNKVYKNMNLLKCPEYWGGYSFTPYCFEFWEGNESRLNKRDLYELDGGIWRHSILQP